jgi:hypothetical protein
MTFALQLLLISVIPAPEPEPIEQCLLNTLESPYNGFRLGGRNDESRVSKP